MVSQILDNLNAKSTNRPATGSSETTMTSCPYEVKDNMFLWDMPGLGGNVVFD